MDEGPLDYTYLSNGPQGTSTPPSPASPDTSSASLEVAPGTPPRTPPAVSTPTSTPTTLTGGITGAATGTGQVPIFLTLAISTRLEVKVAGSRNGKPHLRFEMEKKGGQGVYTICMFQIELERMCRAFKNVEQARDYVQANDFKKLEKQIVEGPLTVTVSVSGVLFLFKGGNSQKHIFLTWPEYEEFVRNQQAIRGKMERVERRGKVSDGLKLKRQQALRGGGSSYAVFQTMKCALSYVDKFHPVTKRLDMGEKNEGEKDVDYEHLGEFTDEEMVEGWNREQKRRRVSEGKQEDEGVKENDSVAVVQSRGVLGGQGEDSVLKDIN